MPVIKWEYYPIGFVNNPKTKQPEIAYRPLIPIRLAYKHKLIKLPILALVDSGADRTLFPASVAEALGIKLERGAIHQHLGIGDVSVISYSHNVKIFLALSQLK